MTLVDQIEFFLDANQASVADAFLRALARIIVVLGCRGSGKSGLIRAIILMLAISSRKQILYFSQSNSNSLDQFQKLCDDATLKSYLLSSSDREPYTTKPVPTLRFSNGSEVLFFSLEDNVSKRGFHPHAILVDECQSISESSWSSVVYPMRIRLGDKPAPVLCFGSTPATDGHWFYRLYEDGLKQPNKRGAKSFAFNIENSLSFKGPQGRQALDEARANMSQDAFDCEFRLIPGGRGDSFFRSADIDACVAAYNPADVDLSRGTIMTLDPSLGTSDPTAYTIMDLKGNIFHSHSIPIKTLKDTEQVQEIVDKAKQYKSLVVVESNASAWMTYAGSLKLLVPHGVMEVPLRSIATKGGDAKHALCKQLAWAMENRRIRINPECTELIRQLKNIRDYKTPNGNIQIRAPEKEHDDEGLNAVTCVEALMRGWTPYLGPSINPAEGLL